MSLYWKTSFPISNKIYNNFSVNILEGNFSKNNPKFEKK